MIIQMSRRDFSDEAKNTNDSYVRIGWTHAVILFKWARQNKSRRTISAKTAGSSLAIDAPRSINSISSGAVVFDKFSPDEVVVALETKSEEEFQSLQSLSRRQLSILFAHFHIEDNGWNDFIHMFPNIGL